MKKVFSFLLSLSMIASFGTVTASAANVEDLDNYAADGVIVYASEATEPVDLSACVASASASTTPPVADDLSICVASTAGQTHVPMARTTTFDLANGSIAIDWDLSAEKSLYSVERFKTNTQNIKVHLKGDVSVSLTVRLYNNSGTLVGTKTANVSTIFGTDYTFSSLTASETYYIQITNNGQMDVNITGSVSQ